MTPSHPRWKYKLAEIPEGATDSERWLAEQLRHECLFSYQLYQSVGEESERARSRFWVGIVAGVFAGTVLSSIGFLLSRML